MMNMRSWSRDNGKGLTCARLAQHRLSVSEMSNYTHFPLRAFNFDIQLKWQQTSA